MFWLAFFLFILGFFLLKRETIANSIRIIQSEVFPGNSQEKTEPLNEFPDDPAEQTPKIITVITQSPAETGITPSNPQPVTGTTPPEQPQVPVTAAPQETQTGQSQTPQLPVEQRDRVLYFTQVDRDGTLLRVRADRRLPLSDTPMIDVLQTLLAGPNNAEAQNGYISLIPAGAKIISAAVRSDTAYINFSEDFMYNTYGAEGYIGQLRQVIYTATEFPNVRYVQILIEGRRVDYLGESVWIGSPLNRDTY